MVVLRRLNRLVMPIIRMTAANCSSSKWSAASDQISSVTASGWSASRVAASVNPVREVDAIEARPKNPPRALTGLGTGGQSRIRPDRRRTDLVEVEDRVLLIFGERALRGLDG